MSIVWSEVIVNVYLSGKKQVYEVDLETLKEGKSNSLDSF